jgi:fructose-1,6-bisphosphatase/inositol monophosphatase family enzyme
MFARRIVPQWAPALGFCRLAEGRIHAIVCNDTWVEDHAAGALIAAEAGAIVTNFYHHDYFNHRESGVIVTNNRANHHEIVEFLRK